MSGLDERKRTFLNEKLEGHNKEAVQVEKWFIRSQDYEKKMGKDLSCFNKEEALEYLRVVIDTNSISLLNKANYYMTLYTDWMLQNGYADKGNAYETLSLDDLGKCLVNNNRIGIIDRDMLNELCDRLYNPQDRYFFVALYEGLRGREYEEIINLRIRDVDFTNKKITVRSRNDAQIEMSDKLAFSIFEAYQEEYYVGKNGSDVSRPMIGQDGVVFKFRHNSVEGTSSANRARAIYTTFLRVINSVTNMADISVAFIIESGIVDFVKRKANENGMTVSEYYNSRLCRADIKKQFGINNFNRKFFAAKYKDYLK